MWSVEMVLRGHAYVESGSSLCWEGGEEGGRDGGREGGRKTCTVCVQTDRWCTVCTLIVKQYMSLCTYHDENVNLALEELDSYIPEMRIVDVWSKAFY